MVVVPVPEEEFGSIRIAVAINLGNGWSWVGESNPDSPETPPGYLREPAGYVTADTRSKDDAAQIRREHTQDLIARLFNRANSAREDKNEFLALELESIAKHWQRMAAEDGL